MNSVKSVMKYLVRLVPFHQYKCAFCAYLLNPVHVTHLRSWGPTFCPQRWCSSSGCRVRVPLPLTASRRVQIAARPPQVRWQWHECVTVLNSSWRAGGIRRPPEWGLGTKKKSLEGKKNLKKDQVLKRNHFRFNTLPVQNDFSKNFLDIWGIFSVNAFPLLTGSISLPFVSVVWFKYTTGPSPISSHHANPKDLISQI